MKVLKLFIKNLFFLVFFIILGDLIISYINETRSYNRSSARVINPFFHHGFIPNRKFKHEWVEGLVIEEVINKFGFRENMSDKNIGVLSDYNTVLLGDSFIEGLGIDNENILASLLKPSLHPVANLGVSSFSPSLSKQRLNYFKNQGFKPKKIIHFVDISDIQDEYLYEFIEGFKPINLGVGNNILKFINNNSISKSFTYKSILRTRWLLNTSKPVKNFFKVASTFDIYANYPGGKESKTKERNPFISKKEPHYFQFGKRKLFNEIDLLISNHKGSYTVVIYPYPNKLNFTKGDHGYYRFENFKQELKKIISKYKYASLCDLYNADFIEDDFIKNDIHWNKKGTIKVSKYINNYCL